MDVLKYSIRFLDFTPGDNVDVNDLNMYSDLEIYIVLSSLQSFPIHSRFISFIVMYKLLRSHCCCGDFITRYFVFWHLMTACLNRTIQIVFVSQYSSSVIFELVTNRDVSSANERIFALVQFTYNKYRRGPNFDPCGTPHSIFWHCHLQFSN